MGLLNYYNKFLPNLATRLAPLHELLRQDARWKWNKEQDEAFQNAKDLLNTSDVLVHYSADRQLVLSCDASPYGVGAVLSKMEVRDQLGLFPVLYNLQKQDTRSWIKKDWQSYLELKNFTNICMDETL